MRTNLMTSFMLALAGLVLCSVAMGDCPVVDFGDYATGTAITTQYDGATISVQELPGSCGVSYGRIAVPPQGTMSPLKALCVDGGSTPNPPCEFHPQWLRIVFDDPKPEVSFNVGPGNTEDFQDYEIRFYSSVSGPGLLSTIQVTNAGNGVYRAVRLHTGVNNIRRVEIEGTTGIEPAGIECIDDLRFSQDTTAPVGTITVPNGAPDSAAICACNVIPVRGVACDDDGPYGRDMLEYRAAGDTSWTFVDDASVPLCQEGLLYNWSPAAEVMEGYYDLRLSVANACGISASDVTTVYLDRHFDLEPAEVRSPAQNAILGGVICFDGTIWDRCFKEYTVGFRPESGGLYQPVAEDHPSYDSLVLNDPFAFWATMGEVGDGRYQVKVEGTDLCDNTAFVTRVITVDNTMPTAMIQSPAECDYLQGDIEIVGTATDVNLDGWNLAYQSGDSDNWTVIASGDTGVIEGVLATWDTSDLPACAYTLRLRVFDRAVLNCSAITHHVRDVYHSLNVGVRGDFDTDADADVDLVDYGEFQDAFTGP